MGGKWLSAEIASHRPSTDYALDLGLSERANPESAVTTCTYVGYETLNAVWCNKWNVYFQAASR